MHQAGRLSPLRQHFGNECFLAHCFALGQVLHGEAGGLRLGEGVVANPQPLGTLPAVKTADAFAVQDCGQRLGVSHLGQRPGHHHPVKAPQDTDNVRLVTLEQFRFHSTSLHLVQPLGTGSASLGEEPVRVTGQAYVDRPRYNLCFLWGRFDLQREPDEIHGLSLLYSLRSMKSGRRDEVTYLPRSKVVLQAKLLPD